ASRLLLGGRVDSSPIRLRASVERRETGRGARPAHGRRDSLKPAAASPNLAGSPSIPRRDIPKEASIVNAHSSSAEHPEPGTSRGAFLARAAALAGGAAVASGCRSVVGIGAEDAPKAARRVPLANDQPIRMGLIGTGGMGNGHLDSIMVFPEQG